MQGLLRTSLCLVLVAMSSCRQIPDDRAPIRQRRPDPVHSIEFDKLFYSWGDTVRIRLLLEGVRVQEEAWTVVVASGGTKDVESTELRRTGPGRYESTVAWVVAPPSEDDRPNDGLLSVAATETLCVFSVRPESLASRGFPELATDFAFVEFEREDVGSFVEPDIAMSPDEGGGPLSRPHGTLLFQGGVPVQYAVEELVYHAKDDSELSRFLVRCEGEILQSVADTSGAPYSSAHRVAVRPSADHAARLPKLLALADVPMPFVTSRPESLALLSLVLELQMEGYAVSPNPRLWPTASPRLGGAEELNQARAMTLFPGSCEPGDPSRPCAGSVPAAWAFTKLWDADDARIQVAFLDQGFAPNQDFRAPRHGPMIECDMTSNPPRCGPGRATGPPTVGNSFFGERSWHGNGVVATAGAVIGNGWGTAGVGGQVVVPMLYKYDAEAYLFDVGAGIRRAVDDGASVINVSGGFPCRILTTAADFNICTPGGRAALCSVATAALSAAAAAACAGLSWLPGIGHFICAKEAGALAAASSACMATVVFGDLAGPMESAVRYAARHGVPVVASAGNALSTDTLPPVIRDIVDLDVRRTEAWAFMPAMSRDAIAVGSVDTRFRNLDFIGEGVDVWAPVGSFYFHPPRTDRIAGTPVRSDRSFSGTSAAAPFVTGVVALMQAIDPTLNPRHPRTSDSQRRQIVDRIKELLNRDGSGFDNAELVVMGFDDEPERRLVIDPLGALREASAGIVPDTASLGYDASLGYSERGRDDDDRSRATRLTWGSWSTGTLLSLQPDGVADDVDWYTVDLPAGLGPMVQAELEVRTPRGGWGDIGVTSSFVSLTSRRIVGDESVETYAVVAPGGTKVDLALRSPDDNVYRLRVAAPARAEPSVSIWGGDVRACEGSPVTLKASVSIRHARMPFPGSLITWRRGEAVVGTGDEVTVSLPRGMHEIEVRAYDDPAVSASVRVLVERCDGNAPRSRILRPAVDVLSPENTFAYDGFDEQRGQWFKDVFLEAEAVDAEDGVVADSRVIWTTDRTDLQSARLGVGRRVRVRLYSDVCQGVVHEIRLEVQDSAGNSAPVARRRVFIWTLC